MVEAKIKEVKNGFCSFCGKAISYRDEFPENCKQYCCSHCPSSRKTKCEKEQKLGTFMDEFKNW